MLEKAGDYLSRRIQRLDLDRADALEHTQTLLDELYPNQARALSLNGEILKIVTQSASVASDLRLRQVQIIKRLSTPTRSIKKLHIQIRSV